MYRQTHVRMRMSVSVFWTMMAYTEWVRLVLTADSRVLVTCVPANGMLSMCHGYISVGQFNNSQKKNKSKN